MPTTQATPIPALLLICGLSLIASPGAGPAADKEPAKEKPKPPQVVEAEQALTKFNCALHGVGDEDAHKKGQRRMPFQGASSGPIGHVDQVAFPATTKDADLIRLMPHVAKLPALKTISFGNNALITEKGLKSLKTLPKLEAIFLDHTSITADGLRELAGVKGLKWLDLSGTMLDDDAMKNLGAIMQLNTLVIRDMPRLTAAGIKNVVALGQLRFLDVTIAEEPMTMARALATAKFLVSLKVSPVSDAEAVELGKMAGLDTLDLSNNATSSFARRDNPRNKLSRRDSSQNTITDAGMNSLAGCKSLRSLDLTHNVDVTGTEIERFVSLKRLEELYLHGTAWEDEGLANLGLLPTLRVIDLRDTKVTDKGLADLGDLPAVQRLYLGMLPLTDAGLRELTRLRSLQVLDLSMTRITCARISDLKNLSQLEQLHLASTAVTAASFGPLGTLKSLRFLNLLDNCPEVSATTIQPLKDELPNCTIIASETPRFSLMGVVVGWPAQYEFRLPEIKYAPPPKLTAPTVSRPTIKLPPSPPPPPPLRVPMGGGTTTKQ